MNKHICSARYKFPDEPIEEYISNHFYDKEIVSIFGFTEMCKLYGGRKYKKELTDKDIEWMYKNNIGYRIPLTTLFFNDDTYNSSKAFLNKYHKEGNSVIIANDALREKIRKDFPLYKIELSVINELNTVDQVNTFTKLYDSVVLHMKWNLKYENLSKIVDKDKIILFEEMKCLYNCKDKVCYKNASVFNSGITEFGTFDALCSIEYLPREDLGTVNLGNINLLNDLGFYNFKLVPKDRIKG